MIQSSQSKHSSPKRTFFRSGNFFARRTFLHPFAKYSTRRQDKRILKFTFDSSHFTFTFNLNQVSHRSQGIQLLDKCIRHQFTVCLCVCVCLNVKENTCPFYFIIYRVTLRVTFISFNISFPFLYFFIFSFFFKFFQLSLYASSRHFHFSLNKPIYHLFQIQFIKSKVNGFHQN